MNLAVALLLFFLVIMFSGSMLPPISEAAVSTDMGAGANPLKLMIPLFIIVILLIAIIKLTAEK